MKAETREWLGLAPADWPIYAAIALLVVMYYVDNFLLDIALASISIGLTVWSCLSGMKHDPNVSTFTNVAKKIVYPLCLAIAAIFVYLHFYPLELMDPAIRQS